MDEENKDQGPEESIENKTFTEEVTKACMDSEGYMLFAGFITNEKDDKGNAIIQWRYRRFRFSFDDMDEAISQLKAAFRDDVLKSL